MLFSFFLSHSNANWGWLLQLLFLIDMCSWIEWLKFGFSQGSSEQVTFFVLCINLFLYTWDALRVSVIEVTWASSWLWPLHGKTLLEQLKHLLCRFRQQHRHESLPNNLQMMAACIPIILSCLPPRSRGLNVHGGNSWQRGRAQSVLQAGRGNCSLSL